MSQSYKNITNKIKKAVREIDSSAEVILYGSRARGDAKKDSDWDILILENKPVVTLKDEQKFRHRLYDIGLETEQSISVFAYSKKEWETRYSIMPLYKNIKQEGIYL
jgi:uncharacterized protein